MSQFEALVGILLAAVLLAAFARRIGAPYPAFLALGGAMLAFVPGVPTFRFSLSSRWRSSSRQSSWTRHTTRRLGTSKTTGFPSPASSLSASA